MKFKTGIQGPVLQLLKHNSVLFEKESDRNVSLMFDEMDIKQSYSYDSRNKIVLFPAKHVQVVMIRGISAQYKQPIFFDFAKSMTKAMLLSIIQEVEKCGYQVRGIICDLGNHRLISELNLFKEHSFPNPIDSNR